MLCFRNAGWLVAVIGCCLMLVACGGKPTTRGDIADRPAAMDAAECAKSYYGGQSSIDNWTLCVDAVSDINRRDVDKVRQWVNKQQGRIIFPQ